MEGTANKYLGNNFNSGVVPSADFPEDLRTKVMPIAPNGTTQVCLTEGRVSEANDAAILNAVKSF